MSKIKVDIIQDTSGNQMKFPSTALSDGYLGVSSSGVLSSHQLEESTTGLTLYDASVSGGNTQANVLKEIPSAIKAKMLAGVSCTVIMSGVSYLGGGMYFTNASNSPQKWGNGQCMWKYKRENSDTYGYETSLDHCRSMFSGLSDQNAPTADHAGGCIFTFRLIQNSSDSLNYTVAYESLSLSTTAGLRPDENSTFGTSEGRMPVLDTFTHLYFAGMRVASNGYAKLFLQE
tara:strand:- start:4716 stop:5408 length:693 start_codon:yes stop_codon:yes gene_type:complete